MDAFNVPKILFIQGVFKDILTTTIKKPKLPGKTQNGEPELKMQKFYVEGNSLANIERQVCCMTCHLKIPITMNQLFIPESMEKANPNSGKIYKKLGTMRFHRWGCAAYYIENFLKNDLRYKLLLKQLYQSVEKIQNIIEIESVTLPSNIDEYGGDQTREQWELFNDNKSHQFQMSFNFTERTVGS